MTSSLIQIILLDLARTRHYKQKHPARGGNKIYVKDVHEIPAGSQVHEGPLRGIYYIPDRRLKRDVRALISKKQMNAKLALSKYYQSKSTVNFKNGRDKEGNPILATLLYKYMGYDKRPEVVSDEEISHLAQSSYNHVLYRGVGGKTYDGWVNGADSNIRPGVYGSGSYTVEVTRTPANQIFYSREDLLKNIPHMDPEGATWCRNEIIRLKTYLNHTYAIDNLVKEFRDNEVFGNFKWSVSQGLADLYFEGDESETPDRIYNEIYDELRRRSSQKRIDKFKELYPHILPESPEDLRYKMVDSTGKVSYQLVRGALKDIGVQITVASDKSIRISRGAEEELIKKYGISPEGFSPDEYLERLSEYNITKEDVERLPASTPIMEEQASALARFYANKSKDANIEAEIERKRMVKGEHTDRYKEKEIKRNTPGIISRMVLDKYTSLIDIDDLLNVQIDPDDYGVPPDKQEDFLTAMNSDPGLKAMVLGYDAYRVPLKYNFNYVPDEEEPITNIYEDYDNYYGEGGEETEDDYEGPDWEDKYYDEYNKIMSAHRLKVDNPYIVVLNRGALKVSDKNYW